MMIVGMSVVVTVIVLQFHHHDPQGGKMPKWVSDQDKPSILPFIKNTDVSMNYSLLSGSSGFVELVRLVSPYETTW